MGNRLLALVKARLALYCGAALVLFSLLTTSAQAEIRVSAAGSDIAHATEEFFTNGKLVGHVDRPGWTVSRELTAKNIVDNYDVLLIPHNTPDWQYGFDWNTQFLAFLASDGTSVQVVSTVDPMVTRTCFCNPI